MVQEIMDWVVQNWEGILGALAALVIAARAISRLTPTKKDDRVVEKIRKVLDVVGNIGIPDVQAKKTKRK